VNYLRGEVSQGKKFQKVGGGLLNLDI